MIQEAAGPSTIDHDEQFMDNAEPFETDRMDLGADELDLDMREPNSIIVPKRRLMIQDMGDEMENVPDRDDEPIVRRTRSMTAGRRPDVQPPTALHSWRSKKKRKATIIESSSSDDMTEMQRSLPTIDEVSEQQEISSQNRELIMEHIERDMRKQELLERAQSLQEKFEKESEGTGGPGSKSVRGGVIVEKTTEELEKEKEELTSLIDLLEKTRQEEIQWRKENNMDELDRLMAKIPSSKASTTSTEPGKEDGEDRGSSKERSPRREIVRGEQTYPTRTSPPRSSPPKKSKQDLDEKDDFDQIREQMGQESKRKSPRRDTVRGEHTYPTTLNPPKKPPMTPSLQEVVDEGRGALMEPALNFDKWAEHRRREAENRRAAKNRSKRQKTGYSHCCEPETEENRPTSSDIVRDQFVVEPPKEDEKPMEVELPDRRSSLEKLQDEYELEQGQKIVVGEDPENSLIKEAKEEELKRRQIEDDAKKQQEDESRRREKVLEEMEKMEIPPAEDFSQESYEVTMESVDEETGDERMEQGNPVGTEAIPSEDTVPSKGVPEAENLDETESWTPKDTFPGLGQSDNSDEVLFKARTIPQVYEDPEYSITDKTESWTPEEKFPGFDKTEDSDEILFKARDPGSEPEKPISEEVQYVDMPAEDVRGPNYCPNIILTEGDLFESVEALGHAVSADMRMGAGIAYDFKQEFGGIQELFMQKILPGGVAILERDVEISGVWDTRFIYNLVTKTRYHDKPQVYVLKSSLYEMRKHAKDNGLTMICLPRIGAGLDQLKWADVYAAIAEVFGGTEIYIRVFLLPRKIMKLEVLKVDESQEPLWDYGLWYCEGKSQLLLQFISQD
jgi:O-acetyl-ADP-ribose deacetylase (regulator of RNase III)